jgi:hypothetical protein
MNRQLDQKLAKSSELFFFTVEDGDSYLGKYALSYPGPVRSASDIYHRILFTVRAHYKADNRERTWRPTERGEKYGLRVFEQETFRTHIVVDKTAS